MSTHCTHFKLSTSKILFILLILSGLLPPLPTAQAAANGKYDIYLANGILLINRGEFDQAFQLLHKALSLSPDNPEATYYAGVAAARLGKTDEAEILLHKTLKGGRTEAGVYVELMRIYTVTENCDKARVTLARYSSESQDQTLLSEMEKWSTQCGVKRDRKTYGATLRIGAQHDSNVLLEPSNPPVTFDDKSDIRGVTNLDAHAQLYENQLMNLNIRYRLYYSHHADLDDFNILDQYVNPELVFPVYDRFTPSLGYALQYTLFKSDDYSRAHSIYGKLLIPTSDTLTTELLYEYTDHTYWDTDLFLTNDVRTGFMNTIGIKERFLTDQLQGSLYYQHDRDRVDVDYWDFNGHRFGVEAARMIRSFTAAFAGEYQKKNYLGDFPGTVKERSDKTQKYSIGLSYPLTKKLRLTLTDTYMNNSSNLKIFDYSRNIVGIHLSMELL